MRSTIGTKFLRTLIAAGYLLMCLLAVGHHVPVVS